MKSYTKTEVTVSLSEGELEEDGVTIEFFGSS